MAQQKPMHNVTQRDRRPDDGRIRVGLIGLGRAGWSIHLPGLEELSDLFRIVALSDHSDLRRGEAARRCPTAVIHARPGSLIADPEVELVVIATPTASHAELTRTAIEAGKSVVVEKPFASSYHVARELFALAADRGVVVTAFQNSGYEPGFEVIRKVIDSGVLGEISLIRRTRHRYAPRDDWQTLASQGGGELFNIAGHVVHQLLSYVPEPVERLYCDLRRTVSAGDAEDHVKLVLRGTGGPTIDIETSATVALPQSSWFVCGSLGALSGDDRELRLRTTELKQPPCADPSLRRKDFAATEVDWGEERIVPGTDQRTVSFYGELHRCLRDNEPVPVSAETVLRQLAILEQARTAAEGPETQPC